MKAPVRCARPASYAFEADFVAMQFLSGPATLSDLHGMLAGATSFEREMFLARVSTRVSRSGMRLSYAQIQFLTAYADYGDQEADVHRDLPQPASSK